MNIILSDRADMLLPMILKHTDWEVGVLIVQDEEKKEKYEGNAKIKSIFTLNDITNQARYTNFSYEEIKKFKRLQAIGDAGTRRMFNDYQFSRYTFYASMAFFNNIFSLQQFDACVITEPVHGFASDYILFEYAELHHVPVYNLATHGFGNFCLNRDLENGGLVSLSDNPLFTKERFYETAHYTEQKKSPKNEIGLKNHIKKWILHIGGMALFRTFFCLTHRNRFMTINFFPYTLEEYYFSWYKIWSIRRYVRKLYSRYDADCPYLIYFLHFEPEASITNYAETLDSQLVIIEMISQCLPEGWTLYVKEHPDTYKLNTERFDFFVPTYSVFQSKYFFRKMDSLKNVSIIDYKTPATEVIRHAKAVASICGTVLMEAILEKKPVLTFANPHKYILSQLRDVFSIQSFSDLAFALDAIQKDFDPNYDDLYDVYKRYLLPINEDGLLKALSVIVEELKGNCDGN